MESSLKVVVLRPDYSRGYVNGYLDGLRDGEGAPRRAFIYGVLCEAALLLTLWGLYLWIQS